MKLQTIKAKVVFLALIGVVSMTAIVPLAKIVQSWNNGQEKEALHSFQKLMPLTNQLFTLLDSLWLEAAETIDGTGTSNLEEMRIPSSQGSQAGRASWKNGGRSQQSGQAAKARRTPELVA